MPSYQPALTTQFSPQDCLSRIVHDIHMKDPTKRLKTWPNGYRMDELHSHLGDVGCRLGLGEKEDAHEFIFQFVSAMPMCLPAFEDGLRKALVSPR
ncbi:hypothetical protein DYB37_006248 [Aphanomyces astaci]|uniref:Uncharacterized protein n=1 Tax=Aphanomyces astaci TaxID=112090 RepID=A0A418E227_APHAT|nr:hypothetical protein DYB37_006248 [Aphanomyces astaci]